MEKKSTIENVYDWELISSYGIVSQSTVTVEIVCCLMGAKFCRLEDCTEDIYYKKGAKRILVVLCCTMSFVRHVK